LSQKFIVVDDDFINNIFCSTVIERTFPEADIQTFTEPEKALAYIQSMPADTYADTVLFLDINMPTLTGWEFLDFFEEFDLTIKDRFRVYMLSSSIDPGDKARATSNKNVLAYFEKPLTKESIESLRQKL
jgi:CheY-like chemotaxis protein